MVYKLKIIKQELQFEECLKQRLEFICEFSKVTPTFINGSIRKLEKTNLTYIEPHRVIIKNITFLVFNYSNDVYISNLTKKINTIVALKLDRITRSIYDWENLMTFLDENDAYLDCVNDEINTTSANGKMISRLFRITQTESKLKKDNIFTEKEANKTHYNIGKNIKEVIAKNGGTMPEDLPTPKKSLKQLEKENKKTLKRK